MKHKFAYVFPGQGSQYIGMGKDLYENSLKAQELFQSIDTMMGKKISSLCFDGEEAELTKTIHTQPAILSVSIVLLNLLRDQIQELPSYVAGHSLGEYSALYAANVINLETVVQLVKKRAELMEEAQHGAMSAVIGLSPKTIDQILATFCKSVVAVANYNTYDQTIISGDFNAMEQIQSTLLQAGAKRVLPLNVGGAFHSPLMNEASQAFKEFLQSYSFSNAGIPVITNVDAQVTEEAMAFKIKLSQQISSSVQWVKTIERMLDEGVNTFVEIGPGKVLAGLIKKINRQAHVINIYNEESLHQAVLEMKNLISEQRKTYV